MLNSKSLNQVTLVGRLGKDPNMGQTKTGNTYANFSLATTMAYQDKEGNWQEKTTWIDCVAFGPQSQSLSAAHKGDLLQVLGHLSVREWQDGEVIRKVMEVGVDACQILASAAKKAESKPAQAPAKRAYAQATPTYECDCPDGRP